VRDFLKDEAFNQQDRVLHRYLKPDLLIVSSLDCNTPVAGLNTTVSA
jgi:hypothetical protein